MVSADEILADNLREALKDAHRHIVFGTGAALFFLLLVIQQMWGQNLNATIQLPLIGAPVDLVFAEMIAGVAYFISGYLAYLAVARVHRIKGRLNLAPHLREAALMYPSIPTIILTSARIGALLLPVVLFVGSIVPVLLKTRDPDTGWGLVWLLTTLSAPYVLLIQQLRYPLSEVKYTLTKESLEQVRGVLPADVAEKLESITGQEYPNRDLFVRAVKTALGKDPSANVARIILRIACEEEGIEN